MSLSICICIHIYIYKFSFIYHSLLIYAYNTYTERDIHRYVSTGIYSVHIFYREVQKHIHVHMCICVYIYISEFVYCLPEVLQDLLKSRGLKAGA